jgi:DNA (cytosine-5)-methyltransferase 1
VTAFYNEIDPFAASWLRELIKAGHIAPGIVDERSIEDIRPDELREFTQCHFFAGIGVWSYALRSAGWPDSRPVWTGSCPCQPFSTAGKGTGTTDKRHLWPLFFHLIEECRPGVIFGEQVEAAIRHGWLDLVQTDLEGLHYTFGATGLPAAGFGAPHFRPRIFFVANTNGGRSRSGRGNAGQVRSFSEKECQPEHRSFVLGGSCAAGGLGNTQHNGLSPASQHGCTSETVQCGSQGEDSTSQLAGASTPGVLPGKHFWSDCDLIPCLDGKVRPVEPGTFPLAHGAPNRVGRLRGYGNAIVAPVAQAFIEAYLDTEKSCQ